MVPRQMTNRLLHTVEEVDAHLAQTPPGVEVLVELTPGLVQELMAAGGGAGTSGDCEWDAYDLYGKLAERYTERIRVYGSVAAGQSGPWVIIRAFRLQDPSVREVVSLHEQLQPESLRWLQLPGREVVEFRWNWEADPVLWGEREQE